MTKKLIYGLLIFAVGIALVACGEKESSSSSNNNNNTATNPFADINGNGNNTTINNTSILGTLRVSQPQIFVSSVGNNSFAQQNGGVNLDGSQAFVPFGFNGCGFTYNNSNIITDIWNWFSGGGNGGPSLENVGYTCGNQTNNSNLPQQPQIGSQYRASMQLSGANLVVDIYDIPTNRQLMRVNAVAQNNGQVFQDQVNGVQLVPQATKQLDVRGYYNGSYQSMGQITYE